MVYVRGKNLIHQAYYIKYNTLGVLPRMRENYAFAARRARSAGMSRVFRNGLHQLQRDEPAYNGNRQRTGYQG
jgi:hypothetical protein